MKLGFSLLLLAFFALVVQARAADFDRPLVSGVAEVHIQAAPVGTSGYTRSVGIRRQDTGSLVFCTNLEPEYEAEGPTEAILNLGGEVFLVASAFDGPDCTGLESGHSADRQRITFGPPDIPLLFVE